MFYEYLIMFCAGVCTASIIYICIDIKKIIELLEEWGEDDDQM